MQQMSMMNQGKLDALTADYTITASTGETTTLTMVPKDANVRGILASLEVHLLPDLSTTHEVVMNEPNGDLTRITFRNQKQDVTFPPGTFDQSKPLDIAAVQAAIKMRRNYFGFCRHFYCSLPLCFNPARRTFRPADWNVSCRRAFGAARHVHRPRQPVRLERLSRPQSDRRPAAYRDRNLGNVMADVLVKPDGKVFVMRSSRLFPERYIRRLMAADLACVFGGHPMLDCPVAMPETNHFVIDRGGYKLDLRIVETKPGAQPHLCLTKPGPWEMTFRDSISAARKSGPATQADGTSLFEFNFSAEDPTFAGISLTAQFCRAYFNWRSSAWRRNGWRTAPSPSRRSPRPNFNAPSCRAKPSS